MSPIAGTNLGPYEIIAPIGAGGMGEVFRARDTRLGREVALKILPESFSRDADRLRRFEQEARAVAALNHPNILSIHDIGEQNGMPFIVSERLDGKTFRAELEHGAIPARKAADYGVQVAQGLAAAHDKNIVHRDLKPENLFICRDGRVKILDFGLAKLAPNAGGGSAEAATFTMTSSPTEAGVVMGTAGYMAPEQVRGAPVDPRTDIFAFGAVLFEMISGRRAFQRETAAETMTAILKDDPPELNELPHPVPPGLERIVRRCLEKQPEQRFQSAKDLAFALEALSGSATSKTAPTAAIADTSKSQRWVAPALSAILAMAVVGGIAFLLRPAPAEPPTFKRVSFDRGEIVNARFAPDGKAEIYGARLNGTPLDTYVVREDYPQSVSAGLQGAGLAAVSKQGQMAVLLHPQFFAHFQWFGTLATSPIGGGAAREVLENVGSADWSPDGNELAVIVKEQGKFRLQYPIGKVLLEGSNWLSDLRVSPDGERVAFFRHPPISDDRGDVMVVDRSGRLTQLSSGWESLEGLAWAPSGKEVWFSGATSGDQYCIRAVTLSRKLRTIYCGTAGTVIHDADASGRMLVSSEEHRVAMGYLEHGSSDVRDLSWLNASNVPHLSCDGSEILFTDTSESAGSGYADYTRKTDGSPAVRIGGGGIATDLSPDGKWALILLPGDPAERVQVVPVGAGQPHVLHWDGIEPIWAVWFPDGQHILLVTHPSGPDANMYETDVNGSTPKLLMRTEAPGLISPDGRFLFGREEDAWKIRSIEENTARRVADLQPTETPIAWTSDMNHIFTEMPGPSGLTIYKHDVDSGHGEVWQVIKLKDQVGLRQAPTGAEVAITPDGRRMAFNYSTQLGQLYVSSPMK